MLNLKPPESSCACDVPVERSNHVMTAIPGMLHGHQIHIVWRFLGDNKVVINWMNGAWEVKGEEHAIPVRGVVDQFVRWFLGGTSGRELMRMIGLGISFASQTKLRTHMLIG